VHAHGRLKELEMTVRLIHALTSCPEGLQLNDPARRFTVIPMRHPAALRTVRRAIAERARHVGASAEQRQRAQNVALHELDAGRSIAVAISLGYGVLTGRRNQMLLDPQAPMPA
jgi:hypothetical protein